MRLVVGLGNPGADYRDTRHNLGFRVIEQLATALGAGEERELCGALVREAGELVLARPQTFMNRSGWAVRCLLEQVGVTPADTLVVYDEVALPLGRMRLRGQGSPAGHRGMASIVEQLATEEVPRLRLGIAPAEGLAADLELSEFVLAPFAASERDEVARLIERAAEAVRLWASEGVEKAAARVNAPPPLAEPPPIG